jgi:hypothetical protein
MLEVLTESVLLANLPFTALLGAVVAYWLMVAIGFLHFDGGADAHADIGGDADFHAEAPGDVHGDAHAGVDGDAHADADADADAHGAGHQGLGFLSHVLHFVNIGEVPVMIVVSVLSLWMWLFSMLATHYFSQGSILRALACAVPNVALSLVVTRYLTWPLKKFFGALNREYDEHQPLVGRTCTVMTGEVTGDFGQAQIETRGAPLLVQARASDGQPLRKGETGLVVREDKKKSIYYVVKVTADKLED